MTSSETTSSVFNITNESFSLSITIPGHWQTDSAEKTIDELKESSELRSQNGIELHVEQVSKNGLILINDYSLSSLGAFKKDILEELKNLKYNDLEDLVYRFQLTYGEIIDIIDLKYIPTKRIGYSLPPGIYEVIELNHTLIYILHYNVKVSVTVDDIGLKTNFKFNQTLNFTNKGFSYTVLGFTQSCSDPLDDIDEFYQLITGS